MTKSHSPFQVLAMFHRILDAILGFNKPQYQRRYSQEWDAVLSLIMDEGEFIEVTNHCAKFRFNDQDYSIWASNYPYSFGHAYVINGESVPHTLQYRPKDSTMKRLKAIIEHIDKIEDERAHNRMKRYIYGKD